MFKPGGDGGIDCVIYDPHRVFGGKFCIQAKLYRGTVPPMYVRDLFGAVQHEGATKGLLITTGGFGPSSYSWANGKPLALIDGTGLCSRCATTTGYQNPPHVQGPASGREVGRAHGRRSRASKCRDQHAAARCPDCRPRRLRRVPQGVGTLTHWSTDASRPVCQ